MKKSAMIGVVLGVGAAVAEATWLTVPSRPAAAAFAPVICVKPVNEVGQVTEAACKVIATKVYDEVSDPNQIAGTAVGAGLGLAAASALVSGHARSAFSVIGLVGGAVAGHEAQKAYQKSSFHWVKRQKCTPVTRPIERLIGYDVKYLIDGAIMTTRMDRNPGAMIAIKNGKPVVEQNELSAMN